LFKFSTFFYFFFVDILCALITCSYFHSFLKLFNLIFLISPYILGVRICFNCHGPPAPGTRAAQRFEKTRARSTGTTSTTISGSLAGLRVTPFTVGTAGGSADKKPDASDAAAAAPPPEGCEESEGDEEADAPAVLVVKVRRVSVAIFP
jgi:hypothetical protein